MRPGSRPRGESGATLVESALCLMLFFTIVFGIMEFGRMVWIYDTVSYLAREGSRHASVRGSDSKSPATQASVKTALLGEAIGLDSAVLGVTVTWVPNNSPGSIVRVRVTYPFVPFAPFVPAPTIAATSQMVISQ